MDEFNASKIGSNLIAVSNFYDHRSTEIQKKAYPNMLGAANGYIISYLCENKDKNIFQRDIEAEFYIARSTVTCLVKQMEQKGYIARVAVERDCRLKRLCLLEKGEKLHECFLQNIDNVEKKVREGIDEEELQTFFKVAKQIRENLEQMQ